MLSIKMETIICKSLSATRIGDDDLESSSDDFDDSDEEQIKAMRLMLFKRVIQKMSFWGGNFKYVF